VVGEVAEEELSDDRPREGDGADDVLGVAVFPGLAVFEGEDRDDGADDLVNP
jgi:hypothetical protein